VFNLPQSTNSELRYLIQMWFCAFIASVYTFTILFFPPTLELMFDSFFSLTNCYANIRRRYTGFQSSINSQSGDSIDLQRNLAEFKTVAKGVDGTRFKRKFKQTRGYIREVRKELEKSGNGKD
jgi:hypothetical protein